MSDKSFRSLVVLSERGSSSRVLNLVYTRKKHGQSADYGAAPFFRNPILNRAIILKHRLRENESFLFDQPKQTATKLIFPIDTDDLRAGGRTVFVGQRGYALAVRSATTSEFSEHDGDGQLLEALDELPSLDPFILREFLAQKGYRPAPCYFEISEADMERMFRFAQSEVQNLVRVAMQQGGGSATLSAKLAQKLLASSMDPEMEALRQTLRMTEKEFREGMFCWKGFLYYKWSLSECVASVKSVTHDITAVQTRGPADNETREYNSKARLRINEAIRRACLSVSETLSVYDVAYRELTEKSNPVAFRDFLLQAPALFMDLGEKLGVVQHVVTFWNYRFPPQARARITPGELREIFEDFEDSLGVVQN